MSNFEDDDRPTFRAITLKLAVEDAVTISARRERRRIRRFIAPHLKRLEDDMSGLCDDAECVKCVAYKAIDAATKAPRKAKAK